MKSILLVDIGSIQTKTLLIEKHNDNWQIVSSARERTTIEDPNNDALVGIKKALNNLNINIDEGKVLAEAAENVNISSSAGGGLQMIVLGVVKTMTAESAMRAALGSGAIVTKVISGDNVLKQPERFKQLHKSRPDIILLAGGTDGGNIDQVLDLAETISAAQVKSRWNESLAPVVYAGNKELHDEVRAYLSDNINLKITQNIRPDLEVEETDNVNTAIQELYMNNVVKNLPGLDSININHCNLKPTPKGMRDLVDTWSKHHDTNTILFDIGGLTTDSYSSIEYVRRDYNIPAKDGGVIIAATGFTRERRVFTAINASAGLGYGAARLLKRAGINNICRWIKYCDVKKVYNDCFNRSILPMNTSEDETDLNIALTAEALRLSFKGHQEVASKLKGVSFTNFISDMLNQKLFTSGTLAKWSLLDNIILTGGIFPHLSLDIVLPIVNESLQPLGITNVYLDQHDYLSQIANLKFSSDEPLLELVDDILLPLTTIIAPLTTAKKAKLLANVSIRYSQKPKDSIKLESNDIYVFKPKPGEKVIIEIHPTPQTDFGNGAGVPVVKNIVSGKLGIVLDARRPIKEDFTINDIERSYKISCLGRGEHNDK